MTFLGSFFSNKKLYFISWLLWGVFFAFIVGYTATHIGKRTVTPSYWAASRAWITGQDIYDNSGRGFIYSPQSAILQIPLALLPFWVAEILWRLINIGLFAMSCYLFSRLKKQNREQLFFMITLFSVLLGFSSARNGQANIMVISLMLIMTYFMCKDRLWSASLIAFLGLCIKPFMIVPICLFSGLFPGKFLLKCILAIAAFTALPYLTQDTKYVSRQLTSCIQSLLITTEIGRTGGEYEYLFSIFRAAGFYFSGTLETILSLISALFFYGYCLSITLKSRKTGIIVAAGASAVFILLFNSRTEGNTYVLIAPFLAAFSFIAWDQSLINPIVWKMLIVFSFISILGSHEIGKLITPDNTTWLAPLGTVIVSILACYYVLQQVLKRDT